MASYKVAQDVEAEDKLLGPFTMRQMIYLAIVAMLGAVAYFLWQILPPLAMIPVPILLFFAALALPLRKDQPMETYIAAMISFYLKPRRRLWVPDGIESLVHITAPRVSEDSRTKSLSEMEAERRLAYLATIVDTGGWAIRNVTPGSQTSMNDDLYNEAQRLEDPLDDVSSVGQSFERMIDQADATRRQEAMDIMRRSQMTQTAPAELSPANSYPAMQAAPSYQTPPTAPQAQTQLPPAPTPLQPTVQPQAAPAPMPVPVPMPAPTPQVAPQPSSIEPPSADIMELANNKDLSIETIAHEAHRRHQKKLDDGEVMISLR